jgi:hypothetical protein
MARALTILPHPHHVAFESYGVRIAVTANDSRVVERFPFLAPLEARPCEVADADHHVDVTTTDGLRFNAKYDVHPEPADDKQIDDDIWVAGDADLELVLALLEAHVHECIALNAPDHLFVRAGAVLHQGYAIVLPGEGLSGKSTLVAALARAGAVPYSGDYAVFDADALVHPYTRRSPLTPSVTATNGSDGGAAQTAHVEPRETAVIAFTSYLPGAEWRPQRMSRGESMLALLAYAVPGEDRPKQTMSGVSRLLEGDPVVMRGERGEADAMASALLTDAELARSGAA